MCCIVYTLCLEWLGLKHKQNTSNRTAVNTSSNVTHSLYNSIVLLVTKCDQEETVGSDVVFIVLSMWQQKCLWRIITV